MKEKENKKLQLKKKIKKQDLKERGITLIALVVTIIILLILTGVTLNIALSDDGLFNKTKKAVEDYKQAQSDEEEAIRQIATQLYSEYVGATVIGYNPTGESASCSIGQVTSGTETLQNFNREQLNWRVWDYDGNILRMIGDPTGSLTLKGAAGYNNGVWAVDHICKELYSNNKKGVSVTNLKRTDIQKVSTYDYTKYKHDKSGYIEDTTSSDDNGNLIYFGESKTYASSNQYPKMWNDNDKNWTYEYKNKDKTATGGDEECEIWEVIGTNDGQITDTMTAGSDSTTFKQSYYYHNYKESEFINDAYYDLIFKKADGTPAGYYWLAGRYVRLCESYCDFGVQRVYASSSGGFVHGNDLCDSNRYYD